jgi:hypothetical protein
MNEGHRKMPERRMMAMRVTELRRQKSVRRVGSQNILFVAHIFVCLRKVDSNRQVVSSQWSEQRIGPVADQRKGKNHQ